MKKILLGVIATMAISSFSFTPKTKNDQTEKTNNNAIHLEQNKLKREVPGTDGAGGSGSSPRNYYGDKDSGDDQQIHANEIVNDKVTITGTLRKYSDWDIFTNYLGGNTTTHIDQDWYKFTLREKARYKIDMTAPYGYKCSLRKYRGGSESEVLEVVWGTYSKEIDLTTGTYYLHVTVEDADRIQKGVSYIIKLDRLNYLTNGDFALNEENLSNYVGAIWENDMEPDNLFDRWDHSGQKLHIFENDAQKQGAGLPGSGSSNYGYIDPIFNNKYLDSVLLIWDKDIIKTIGEIFEQLDHFITHQLGLDSSENEKIEFDADILIAAGGLVLDFLSYCPGKFGKAVSILCTVNHCLQFGCMFVDKYLKGESLEEYKDNFGRFLQGIKSECHHLSDPNVNGILCIPRYGETVEREGAVKKPDGHEVYQRYTKWRPSVSVPDFVYKEYFEFDENSLNCIQKSKFDGSEQYYRGTTRGFSDFDELESIVGTVAYQYADSYKDDLDIDLDIPEPEPEPEVGVTDFYLNPKADFDNNTIELQFDYYDPNDELHDFVFYLNSPAGGRPYYLNKTDDIQILSGNSYNNYVYFDFSDGEEYFYSFSYYKGDQWIEYYGDALVFEDKNANDGELDPEDFFNDPHPYIGPEQPYIPPYIGGGSEPWIGGGIGGGFEIPDKPWIGGGIGGGGFDGGLGGGGN